MAGAAPVLRFDAELWRWEGEAAWHFVTLPPELADDIAARTEGRRKGFGSVRVSVRIGATTWKTSIFPDARSGSFVLPLKQDVRRREDVGDGDVVVVDLEVLG